MTSFNVQSVEDLQGEAAPVACRSEAEHSDDEQLGQPRYHAAFGGLQKLNRERVYAILDKVLGERPEDPTRRSHSTASVRASKRS